MADDIQKDAEAKLGRSLSSEEANAIRNAGSLMMLESVAMSMERASTAEAVLAQIADAQSAFADRLVDAQANVQKGLKAKLGRALDAAELEAVDAIPNCLAAMLWLHNIDEAKVITEISEVTP